MSMCFKFCWVKSIMVNVQLTKMQKIFAFLAGGIFLVYMASFLMRPFVTVDTPFYTLIGRSILQDHILPYKYIFDHKPFLAFLLYGVWDALMPIKTGMFTVLALCCAAGAAVVASAVWKTSRLLVFAILITTGAAFEMLSGNTESFQMVFQVLVLFLLLRPFIGNIFLAGMVTAFAINVNYLTAECLFVPVIFLLFTQKKPVLKTLTFSVGGCLGLLLLFSPYLLSNPHALVEYFQQQKQFLSGYNQGGSERLIAFLKLALYFSFFIPVVYVWWRQNCSQQQGRIEPSSIVLGLWFVSGLVAASISGHPFGHYYILWFFPVTIMIAQIIQKPKADLKWVLMPVAALTLFSVIDVTINNSVKHKNLLKIDYQKMSHLVDGGSVLNIRALEFHFYMANMRSFDPYLFRDHVDIAFGPNAEEHYMHDLERKPQSVLLTYQGCTVGTVEPTVCHYLSEHYQKVYAVKIVKVSGKINPYSFELYKIKPDS